jgi:hypothetical protein
MWRESASQVQENFTSPKIRKEAQGVHLSSIHSSDKVQGEIAGVCPVTKEKYLCKKENMRDIFGRNHDPSQPLDLTKERGH